MAGTPTLAGSRLLVVGASAGIGRAFARHAVAMGADVCVSARRLDRLEELCGEVGAGHAVAADVTAEGAAERLVHEAASRLGGIDHVLYSAGAARLAPLSEATLDDWRMAYEVNVVGPAMVCRAALPLMSQDGLVSFLSSESTHESRWGLGTYAASKAALDVAIRMWRHEHPERRFQRVVMGATMPTEFGNGFAADHLGAALDRWASIGIQMTAMETDDVGRHLAETIAVVLAHPGIDVPDVYLDARGAPWP